ncbi:MAG: methylenetetrahydrofolate--tRNA-(uracil(54)-C(5))-methyltransferase (FADH(2)-oxidizing) TrmFO [Acidobacteria bacterium]|nr:methylenetetrahydrofolate--tRNA-(uracil(54)-C(5))-methyltransferase (FADH(2)-oxidizing) TrmFO [Acidobacteriota bacterium]MBV9483354.1 methylenetetrahydrofolate--tRNA-(uracil(54)-C(5))-methyltransferase (FADH(2)-oxidizing) TrmFO [Acidobacteriota bacterium]
MNAPVRVIGAGLAGSEAAWQCARRGIRVELCEMRPARSTAAHQTDYFAELVCSNSLKSDRENTAPWLLKEELRRAGSVLIEIAHACAVPAGHALAVDRTAFSRKVTATLSQEPLVTVIREEVTRIGEDQITIIATGPLTSERLSQEIARLTGSAQLYFYDSISPIVEADSIDTSKVYRAARYQRGTADYINCPLSREAYERFYDALVAAQSVEKKDWEKLNYFESCLPIEEIARRGRDTLRFGPMKPVGLKDPRTGQPPYAVVQLRQENLRADSYNLVGFQNHLRFGEQERILRLIPGLENARFLRYGQMHRNTYINGPLLLRQTLETKSNAQIFFAGQICGVEGYVESIATGLLAGMHAACRVEGIRSEGPPRASALGSLVHYVTQADARNFQPANITFDLLPALSVPVRDREQRHRLQCRSALEEFDRWLEELNPAMRT